MTSHNLHQIEQSKNILKTKEFQSGVASKTCKCCQVEKTLFQFPVRSQDKKYFWVDGVCRRCHTARETKRRITATPERRQRQRELNAARQRTYNGRSSKYRASCLLQNYRAMDVRAGRISDLTLQDVKDIIAKPCAHCKRTDVTRGLDRIDNNFGHISVNCIPSCGLCNYLRADLPLEIWEKVVPVLNPHIIAGDLDKLVGGRFSKERCPVLVDQK